MCLFFFPIPVCLFVHILTIIIFRHFNLGEFIIFFSPINFPLILFSVLFALQRTQVFTVNRREANHSYLYRGFEQGRHSGEALWHISRLTLLFSLSSDAKEKRRRF